LGSDSISSSRRSTFLLLGLTFFVLPSAASFSSTETSRACAKRATISAKVRNGEEIFVEHDRRPFAVIRAPDEPGRPIDECIAIAKAYEERLGYAPLADPDFAADVQTAIDAHREPLDPPVWE
jgi:hypothetical protein